MLKNHFLVALRGLRRRGGRATLHVSGLALGLACCFLALLYVEDELSYDRFHDNVHRIYRIGEERMLHGDPVQLLSIDVTLGEAIAAEVPVAEAVVQTDHGAGLVRRPDAGEAVEEADILYASDRFFEVFTFPLLSGDPATALAEPGRVVLSAAAAERHFGGDDPVGQLLLLERQGYGVQETEPILLSVTGVAAVPPANSSIQFDLVVSGTTEVQDFGGRAPVISGAATTFVLTQAPEDLAALETALLEVAGQHGDGFGTFSRMLVDPLPSLHFTYQTGDSFVGSTRYLYLFSVVALVILLIACINYTNLATAYALRRAKEVGVRKVFGASVGSLVALLSGEFVALALAAFVVAAPAAYLLVSRWLEDFAYRVELGPGLFVQAGLVVVVITFLTVSYHAVRAATADPVKSLRHE